MKLRMSMQRVTKTQVAIFAADEPDPAIASIDLAWQTYVDLGRPLEITLELHAIEESTVIPLSDRRPK